MANVTTRYLIRISVARCRRWETDRLHHQSLGPGVLYTPGRAGGWDGPERWSVVRAAVHVGWRRQTSGADEALDDVTM